MNELIKNSLINNNFDYFKNKKALILSCSNSINKFSNIKNFIDDNTIVICIKTSTKYCNDNNINIDIFFYDNRIYFPHRQNFNYILNEDTFKIICYHYEYDRNKTNISHDIEICVKNKNYFEFDFHNYEIIKNNDKTLTINQTGDRYLPISLKSIIFLINLGIKNFILLGFDWYNKNITPQAKHFEKQTQPKIGFDNLIGSFYDNFYLSNLINDYNLNIILLSNYSQLCTKILRIDINNLKFFQKNNFYITCENNINITDDCNYNYLIEYCNKSPYINKKWYKTLLLMFQKIYLQDLSPLNILNHIIIDNNLDPIINLGIIIAMDNYHDNRLIIRNNFL